MEQLTKNQAVATSQEAVQNQNEPQLRDENAHNDKSVHGVLNPTYQAGLRRDAVQPDIEAERKKRDRKCPHKVHRMEMKAAISCTILRHTKILIAVGVRIISLATLGSKNHTTNITKIVTQSIGIIIKRLRSEERFSRNAETDLVCRLLLEKKFQVKINMM